MASRKAKSSPRSASARSPSTSTTGRGGCTTGRGRTGSRKVADSRDEASSRGEKVNSQLTSNEPTLLTFTPIGVGRAAPSSFSTTRARPALPVDTLRRYRSATQHSRFRPPPAKLPKLTRSGWRRSPRTSGRFGWPANGTRTREAEVLTKGAAVRAGDLPVDARRGQVDQGDQARLSGELRHHLRVLPAGRAR